jgi:hypothetical protein
MTFVAATRTSAQTSSASPQGSETVDAADLWRKVRHKPPPPPDAEPSRRAFVVAPVIGVRPDTGPLIGIAGNVAAFHGDPANTHISTSVFSFTFSSKGQSLSNVRFTQFTGEDRWLAVGDNRFQWTSQDTFGLGSSSAESDAVNAKYDFFRLHETVYRRVAPHLFAGGGVRFNTHQDIRPGDEEDVSELPSVTYSQLHGLPIDSGTSGGLSAGIRYDSRDNQIDARRGWYGNVSYGAYFEGFLGGDSSWQNVDFDLRAYRDLTATGRHRLAAWTYGDFVVSGVAPYYDLPATAMDTFGRSGRGYPEGRFRGDQLIYAEVEYRATLTPNRLVGMVMFANATSVSAPDDGEALFHTVAPGGGIGARLLLNKRSGTNLCFDVGFGRDGSRGIYLSVQEAF